MTVLSSFGLLAGLVGSLLLSTFTGERSAQFLLRTRQSTTITGAARLEIVAARWRGSGSSQTETPPAAASIPPTTQAPQEPGEIDQRPSPPQETDSGGWDNVVAALLGAVLAFFATQYHERTSWRRRKAEQLRDRQFATLTDAARKLDSLARHVKDIAVRLNGRSEQMASAGASPAVLMAEAQVWAKGWVQECHQEQMAIGLVLMDMRVLRVEGVAKTLAQEAHHKTRQIIDELERVTPNVPELPAGRILALASELEDLALEFSAAALDAVSE